MQNQQTQQDLQKNTQPFFTTGQGTNFSNVNQEVEPENNLNTSNPNINWQQRRDEIPGQIGGIAIDAPQEMTPVSDARESFSVQAPPEFTPESANNNSHNLEKNGYNNNNRSETGKIIPFPSQNLPTQGGDNAPDNQTSTDSVYEIAPPSGKRDTLSQEDVDSINDLIKEAEDPTQFYNKLTETRAGYQDKIRNKRAA